MADVFIAVTEPEVTDNWKPVAGEPVRSERPTFFAPDTGPIQNSPDVVIQERAPYHDPHPIVSQNPDAMITSVGAPISNDSHAAIFTNPRSEGDYNPPVVPGVMLPSADVRFSLPGGAPISNEVGSATIHHTPVAIPEPVWPEYDDQPSQQVGVPISNERNVSFVRAPQAPSAPVQHSHRPAMMSTVTNDIPRHVVAASVPLNVNGDVFMAPAAGSIQGGGGYNPDAQILPTFGQVVTADTDRTIGGGGDPTKSVRADEVSFSGIGKLDVGGADIMTALTGDIVKVAGSEDVTLTPNAESIGNHEAFSGAQGDPISNKDYNDYVKGAFGKPLKRNVT